MSFLKKLYKKKKGSEEIQEITDVFAKPNMEVNDKMDEEEEIDLEQEGLIQDVPGGEKQEGEEKSENPFVNEEQSILQKKDREERTIFIGNVPLECTKKELIKLFKKYGKIENIRERSVPVRQSKDLSVKARVILKRHVETKESDSQVKNCYILYEQKEDAEKALEKNGFQYKDNFLRVDLAAQKELDFTKTIFVGNLSFTITENQLRDHFTQCGAIVNVRVIRDKETHQGKGFGYVQFQEDEGYQNALQLKGSKLKERELRIKKAVPQARLEKKRLRKEEKIAQNKLFAERRIKDKVKGAYEKSEQGGNRSDRRFITKDNKDAAKKFVENQMENLDEVDVKNNIVVPPRIIRKQIKKSQKRGENKAQKFNNVQKLQQKFHAKNDRNIFNGKQGLKDRKEKRNKRREQNKKKVKKQIINE